MSEDIWNELYSLRQRANRSRAEWQERLGDLEWNVECKLATLEERITYLEQILADLTDTEEQHHDTH